MITQLFAYGLGGKPFHLLTEGFGRVSIIGGPYIIGPVELVQGQWAGDAMIMIGMNENDIVGYEMYGRFEYPYISAFEIEIDEWQPTFEIR